MWVKHDKEKQKETVTLIICKQQCFIIFGILTILKQSYMHLTNKTSANKLYYVSLINTTNVRSNNKFLYFFHHQMTKATKCSWTVIRYWKSFKRFRYQDLQTDWQLCSGQSAVLSFIYKKTNPEAYYIPPHATEQ